MNNKDYYNKKEELVTTNKRFVNAIKIYIVVMIVFGIFSFNNYLNKNNLTFEDFLNEKLNEFFVNDYSDDNDYNDDNNYNDYENQEDDFEDEILSPENKELVLYEYYDNGIKVFSASENMNVNMKFVDEHKMNCKSSNCEFVNVGDENYYNDLFVLVKDGSNTYVYDTKRNNSFDFPEVDSFVFIKDSNNKIDMDYLFIKELYDYVLYDIENKKSVSVISHEHLVFDPFVKYSFEKNFVRVLGDNVIVMKYYNDKYSGFDYKNNKMLFQNVGDIRCYENDKSFYCDLINDESVELIKIINNNYSVDKKLDKIYYSDSKIVFGQLDYDLILYNRDSKIVLNTRNDVSMYNFIDSSVKDEYIYINFKDISFSNNNSCITYRYNKTLKSMDVLNNNDCIQ